MQLKFYAKCGEGGHPPPVVHFPGVKTVGQLHNYVGRRFDAETRQHVADSDPVIVESSSEAGRRLAKLCRRDRSLWPADEATAAFCGLPFVQLAQDADGEWRPPKKSFTDSKGSGE